MSPFARAPVCRLLSTRQRESSSRHRSVRSTPSASRSGPRSEAGSRRQRPPRQQHERQSHPRKPQRPEPPRISCWPAGWLADLRRVLARESSCARPAICGHARARVQHGARGRGSTRSAVCCGHCGRCFCAVLAAEPRNGAPPTVRNLLHADDPRACVQRQCTRRRRRAHWGPLGPLGVWAGAAGTRKNQLDKEMY